MAHPRLLAFAQLLRVPNVFTAFSDIALGTAVAASVMPNAPEALWGVGVLLALASGCLYLAGMVWNDVFDRLEDARARPFRPIPSGRVRVRTAVVLGVVAMLLGLLLAALAGMPQLGKQAGWNHEPLFHAIGIVAAVLAYDGGLKHTPVGPVAMGSCRFLNVLLGLSAIPDEALDTGMRLHIAAVVGIYIVGVTWFARTEEGQSRRGQLVGSACVIALSLVLALVLASRLPPDTGSVLFPYLLVVFGFLIGRPIARAVAVPGSRQVQAAVKRCVLGLVVLDAVLATAFIGSAGLFIVLLLPPALVIGKWVYST
jgi:4-hydroxybenzoate polyprenyltransferase